MCCPSSLTSPTAAIASFVGMQVKICFFLFFSFRSFSDQCYRDSLSHIPGPQTPASPPHNPYPHAFPSTLPNPPTSTATSASPHTSLATSIFTTCKSATTATPSLHTRSTHDADLPHASPAVMPSQHGTQGLPQCQPATH